MVLVPALKCWPVCARINIPLAPNWVMHVSKTGFGNIFLNLAKCQPNVVRNGRETEQNAGKM